MKKQNKEKKEKKMTAKEFARSWKLADDEIKEWIKFKCILFATYEKQKTTK